MQTTGTTKVILARDLDQNATIWFLGTLEGAQAFAGANAWRNGVIGNFRDGSYCYASRPTWLK